MIGSITENDIPAVLTIADHELGKDYLTSDLLHDYASAQEKYVFEIAKSGNDIIGFCVSIVTSKDELKEYIKTKKPIKEFEFSKKIGLIKTVAVKHSFKGKGVGSKLVSNSLIQLQNKHGIRSFCSIGWKNNNKINIEGVLKRLGFTILKEIPEYWASDSIEKEYTCIVCGDPPCKCPAVIFTKTV